MGQKNVHLKQLKINIKKILLKKERNSPSANKYT